MSHQYADFHSRVFYTLILLAISASACGRLGSSGVSNTEAVAISTVKNPSSVDNASETSSSNASIPTPDTADSQVSSAASISSGPTPTGATAIDSNTTGDANSVGAVAERLFVSGDPNRFTYTFFAKQDIGYGTRGDAPVFGLVFTSDGNFCTRSAVPMFLSEFAVYQLPFVQDGGTGTRPLFYNVTGPDLHAHLAGVPSSLIPGYNDMGFKSVCDLIVSTSTAFATPSWDIWTADSTSIDTSTTVNYRFSAMSEAGLIDLVGSAERCQAAVEFFGIHAGNHGGTTQVPCVRTTVAPP